MLPLKNRLLKKGDFQKVYRQGKIFFSPNISLGYSSNSLPFTRIGFVVSKKCFKKAADRNRIKRLMREIIRLSLPQIIIGVDIIFSYRGKNLLNYQKTAEQIKKLLIQSKLTKQ